jgi:hypothetical protein
MVPAAKKIVLAAALTLSTNLHALPPVYTLQGGLGSNDVGPDTDSFYYLTGAVLLSKEINQNSIADLTGEISTYEYADNDNLSSDELFLQGIYNYTPRAGFRVPTYSLGLRYREEFLSGGMSDASVITMLLSIAYRIDDRTSIIGGVEAGERDASIDTDIAGYFVNLDFHSSPRWLMYTTLGFTEGATSVRSYCSGAYRRGSWNWSSWSNAAEDCEKTYLTVGANFVINASNTLDLSVSYEDYDWPGGSVDGNIYSVDYFYRF